ncbi:MAG: ABC transporter permease subunit [Bdellovibrionota bacterium]
MHRTYFPQRYLSVPDFFILLVLLTLIYGIVATGMEWQAEFHPVTVIDLSFLALPKYVLFSAVRGGTAYIISLVFTLVVGYVVAKSKTAEMFIIPLLDVLQSIPVLGFLPGLVLGLISIFPRTNVGLELAAIIMIFTGQVWNMTFSYHSSLKSIPNDYREAATIMGLTWLQKLRRLELPFSAINLAWNSVMSMAGGWFFLSVCEAFTLGEQEYRLPGIGAYMAVAIKQGNTKAMFMGVTAMLMLIIGLDFLLWRPVLAWVRRFRMDEVPGIATSTTEPLMKIMLRESKIVRILKLLYHRYLLNRLAELGTQLDKASVGTSGPAFQSAREEPQIRQQVARRFVVTTIRSRGFLSLLRVSVSVALTGVMVFGAWKLFLLLGGVDLRTWLMIIKNAIITLLKVGFVLVLSTLWAVPVGIWIGTSAKRIRWAQPLVQICASFPAPMLYPLVLGACFWIGMDFNWSSMILMMLGAQWYVLFNVLAGALSVPQELKYALSLMESSKWAIWKVLYIPSIFPALVTGWVSAAGGAWNASIVSEYMAYNGTIHKAAGIGATISQAAAGKQLPVLAASLVVMVGLVLLLGRFVWSPIYHFAQTRYRMDI